MKFLLAGLLLLSTVVAEEFRAARSVHLGYNNLVGDLFYNELIVEKSTDGSYFMACGWDTGYFGIQELRGGKKVCIFSVWDPTIGDDPNAVKSEDRVEVLFSGPETRIKRFGGEGTGGQCMKDFNWNIGETNRFIIHAKTETNDVRKTAYTAYIEENGAWQKLATFRVRTKNEDMRGLYSFVEDFRRDKKSVFDERRARFGNGWLREKSGELKPITRARFTASNATWESKENIDGGLSGNWFYLVTGGDIKSSRELRSVIELPKASEAKPKLPTQP